MVQRDRSAAFCNAQWWGGTRHSQIVKSLIVAYLVLFDGGSDAFAELDDDSNNFASDCSSITISSGSSYVSCSLDDSDCD